jgi:sugar lactone lactonase YvrE
MSNSAIEVAAAHRCVHGEGPVWWEEKQELLWTDIESRELWSLAPASGQASSVAMGQKVCSLAFRERGGLLIAFEKGLSFYDVRSSAETPIVQIEPDLPTTRLNDGRCDRQGRFVVGGFDASEKGLSAAYRLDGDLSLHRLFGGLSSANSTCFSLDGRTMYYADSPQAVIWAFDYDPDTGNPSNRRVFCDFRGQPGVPDGSVIDADGCLWNAQWNGGRVVRYRPDGSIDRVLPVPCRCPTSVAFGGSGLDTLYITTSRLILTEEEARREPLAGTLLAARPGARGLAETLFLG